MNSIILIGRLTKDPELRYTPGDGKAVVNFTLAVNRGYGKDEADFIYIEAWNKQAENIAKYCVKGSLVGIQGWLRIEKYTYQDQNRTVTKVLANQVEFLNSKSDKPSSGGEWPVFEPSFDAQPGGLDPNGFQAIDDDDIPF